MRYYLQDLKDGDDMEQLAQAILAATAAVPEEADASNQSGAATTTTTTTATTKFINYYLRRQASVPRTPTSPADAPAAAEEKLLMRKAAVRWRVESVTYQLVCRRARQKLPRQTRTSDGPGSFWISAGSMDLNPFHTPV